MKSVVDADGALRGSLSRSMWNATAAGGTWWGGVPTRVPRGGLRFGCPRFHVGG